MEVGIVWCKIQKKSLCSEAYVMFMGYETTFEYTPPAEIGRTIWNTAWSSAVKSVAYGLQYDPEFNTSYNCCVKSAAKELQHVKSEDGEYENFMEWLDQQTLSNMISYARTIWNAAWDEALKVVEKRANKKWEEGYREFSGMNI